jgi:hypothetical protein
MRNKHVIVKPIDGVGGEGIFKKIIQSEKEIKELYDYIKGKKVIIEEVISQCAELKDLNPSSVNTIRVYSVEKENRIFITGALLRIMIMFMCTLIQIRSLLACKFQSGAKCLSVLNRHIVKSLNFVT